MAQGIMFSNICELKKFRYYNLGCVKSTTGNKLFLTNDLLGLCNVHQNLEYLVNNTYLSVSKFCKKKLI